jgi:aryl-alcohol dehydrogenase-like predicted oxidoreductase
MKFRYLGKSGISVSRVCLGTMNFAASDVGCDRDTSIRIVKTFLDAGGNFIDTADMYSGGKSEEILAAALKSVPRDDVVVATKVFFKTGEARNTYGLSRKHIIQACEASLRRLSTDYIDLYQVHGPDAKTPMEETMSTLANLVRQGKVRYIGCSNWHAWQVVKANSISQAYKYEKFVSGQYLYNLVVRDIEREILPACEDQGMGVMCWSPLGSGMLSGKYQRADKPDADTRMSKRAKYDVPRYWHERGFRIVDEAKRVAAELGKPAAQVSLAWLLHDARVTCVITGPKSVEQLQQNLEVGDWDLPDESRRQLDEVSAFDPGYPQHWIDNWSGWFYENLG